MWGEEEWEEVDYDSLGIAHYRRKRPNLVLLMFLALLPLVPAIIGAVGLAASNPLLSWIGFPVAILGNFWWSYFALRSIPDRAARLRRTLVIAPLMSVVTLGLAYPGCFACGLAMYSLQVSL